MYKVDLEKPFVRSRRPFRRHFESVEDKISNASRELYNHQCACLQTNNKSLVLLSVTLFFSYVLNLLFHGLELRITCMPLFQTWYLVLSARACEPLVCWPYGNVAQHGSHQHDYSVSPVDQNSLWIRRFINNFIYIYIFNNQLSLNYANYFDCGTLLWLMLVTYSHLNVQCESLWATRFSLTVMAS